MSIKKKYTRNTTTLTPSLIYEYHQLSKLNFDPPYQRDENVWDDLQKSFLIDTMFKNFPMPPIFLEQKVDSKTRKTSYDVIDGKQRLNTIIEFIENKVTLPDFFGSDDYGNELLNGKNCEEISELAKTNELAEDYLNQFWSYIINIEYIENPDLKIVDNIFDRLNRGGERLNPQELRKSNYYDAKVFEDIINVRNNSIVELYLSNLDKNRLGDVSFITEIYLLLYFKKVLDGTEPVIDKYFEEMVNNASEDQVSEITDEFIKILNILEFINIDLESYKVSGVSHQYAIWFLAFVILKKEIQTLDDIKSRLESFYSNLRGDRDNELVIHYHSTMQSSSKSKSARRKRVRSLLNYCEIEGFEEFI